MFQNKELSGFEIFGCPIHFDNNMVRLKDIQNAYLHAGGTKSEEATKYAYWIKLNSTQELLDYLETEDEIYSVETHMIKSQPRGRKGGWYVCRELAHDYAMWLDKRYAVTVLRTFDLAAQGDIRGTAQETTIMLEKQ